MPSFEVDRTRLTAFLVEDAYLFTHYFDNDALYAELSHYYNADAYRFEVPADDLETVTTVLAEHFYDLHIVDDDALDQYCVVVRAEIDDTDLLRNSVAHERRHDATIFLLKDDLAVEQAVEWGATRLSETDRAVPF